MTDKLKLILSEYTDMAPEEITPDIDIKNGLALDSLSLVNIAADIEDEFNIDLTNLDIYNIKTVGDLINLIETSCK